MWKINSILNAEQIYTNTPNNPLHLTRQCSPYTRHKAGETSIAMGF